MSDKKISVLVADDHTIVRAGLRMLINSQADMHVVAEAANGNEAVANVAKFRPDVAVLDVSMPDMNGIRATDAIVRRFPETRVLVLSMHADKAYFRTVLDMGGAGYVLKQSAESSLVHAIRKVHAGGRFLDSELSDYIAEELTNGGKPSKCQLSEREQQVLVHVAQGYTNQEIGKLIHLSPKTVETYRARLLRKLELETRHDLVRFALEAGLLSAGNSSPSNHKRPF